MSETITQELIEALKACSFRLAVLVAAAGDFSDVNAQVLDQAQAVLAKVDALATKARA